MKELIFLIIYSILGAGLLSAYYFNHMFVFVALSVIYSIVLAVDYATGSVTKRRGG